MPLYVALMLLCIRCRTFGVGTDVIMPICCCTDVTVQYVYYGSWSIRTSGLAYDVIIGFSAITVDDTALVGHFIFIFG